MRITGGELAGRKITAPRSDARPTSDRVRESVFAILGDLSGQAVLDLCAGSGALGFEALSRGADSLVSVDQASASIDRIRENARSLGVAPGVRTLRMNALTALARLGRARDCFDLVLIDPPYADDLAAGLAEGVVLAGILDSAGQVVVESDRRHPLGDVPGLQKHDERRYGDTLVTFYRAKAHTPSEPEPSEPEEPGPHE